MSNRTRPPEVQRQIDRIVFRHRIYRACIAAIGIAAIVAIWRHYV